jgi:hypothetical protein
MKVDVEDVLFWMDAIRNSNDRYRTLESFWKGQVRSKVWLIKILEQHLPDTPVDIVIHGGWNGVLASLLFNSNININHITSYDIDPACEEIANTVNKRQEMGGRFCAVLGDSTQQLYRADVVINTICEHLTQEEYSLSLSLVPDNALIVLQSNNYFECDEHVRCAKTIEEFEEQSGIKVLWRGEHETSKYTRFMLLGRKMIAVQQCQIQQACA